MRDGRPGRQERAFRALLRLYPRWFREAHGDEMAELFRARLARASRARARLVLWRRVLADLAGTASALWRGEVQRTMRGRGEMGNLVTDFRHALRRLLRTPLFTLSAVILLALGIGANTAVFTVVNGVLLRPPAWDHPERVVWIYQDSDDGEPNSNSFPAYRDMARSGAFQAVTALSPASAALEVADGTVPVETEYTTASYLKVLGLSPSRGRWFSAEEDVAGGPPAAVVSYPAWRIRFDFDPGIVGRTIRLNDHPVTVVGVGPAELSGTTPSVVTDFWLSISATTVGGSGRVENLERRQDHWYYVLARMAPAGTVARAQAAMDALASRLADQYPEMDQGRNITVFSSRDVRLHPDEDAQAFSEAGLVMAVVAIVLLLACGNLANLLLVRGLGRTGEVAVRRALGAGRGGIARLFLMESLILSLGGGAAGVLLGIWSLRLLPRLPLPYPFSATLNLPLDHRVVLFSALLMVVTGVIFGVAPALRAAGSNVAATLRDEARTASLGRGAARLSRVLVALQVAASLVLVLGAGLLVRSLTALQHVDAGVDADRVAYVQTDLDKAGLSTREIFVTLPEVEDRIAALPGVTAVGATNRLPAQDAGTTTTMVEGYRPPTGTDAVELDYAIVTPSYFPAVGLPILEGRNFGPDDGLETATVVLVNETAARRFWPGEDPIGHRLRAQSRPDSWRTVIGVVADAPVNNLREPPQPMFYFTAGQAPLRAPYLVARTDGDPATLLAPMRSVLKAVRGSLSAKEQGTLRDHFGAELSGPRAATTALGLFSLLAVFLASLGIYAVVASGVARRSAELGIRMALGASRGGLIRMVIGEVSWTVVVGLVLGVALAAASAPRLGSVLFGVAPLDPGTFAGGVVLLLAVSALAAWLPARKAARVDPVTSLRD